MRWSIPQPVPAIRLPWAGSLTWMPALVVLAGCGGSTEETDTAVAVDPAEAVSPSDEVITAPVVGTGGSVVEPPEAPGAPAPEAGIVAP